MISYRKENITLNSIVLKGYHWHQFELNDIQKDGIFYFALNMTSVCNYRCPYCFVGLDNLRQSRDEMSLAEKTRVMREAKECGARVLSIPGRGEPLADPDFWEILNEAEKLGLWVVVYTNAWYLDEEKISALKDLPISLYIKIDSFDSVVYEQLVGRQDVFERVRRNLDLIVNRFNEPEQDGDRTITRLGVNSVVTVQSADSIEEIKHWCAERHIYYTCRSPVKVGEAAKTWDYLVRGQAERLREIGRRYAARNFTSGTELGQCGIYRYGITVDNDGEVLVCPDAHHDFGRIGNVRDSALVELIKRRNALFPLNSSPGYCFTKAHLNPEEQPKAAGREESFVR
jgi:MoaA/NifB/PqqE/SkfB family radical SAM enzyme